MAGTGEVSIHRRGWIREWEARQDGGGRGGGGGRFLVFHFLSSYITLCSTRHQINNGPTYPILSWTSSCCARPPRGVYRPSPSPPFLPFHACMRRVFSLPPSPSFPPTGWKHILRKVFPDLSSKARDRFESNRYISMMTNSFSPPSPFVFLERRNERYGDERNPSPFFLRWEERFFF